MFDDWGQTRYEKILHDGMASSDLRGLLAGISRAMRISHETRSERDAEISSTASGLVAPLVFFYVWWVLRSARSRGVRRIYFMARDGQIFMKVAKLLVEKWGLDIDVRYLYCSREALLLPSFEKAGEFELNWITWGYLSSITVNEVGRRLGLTLEEFRHFLKSYGLDGYASECQRPVSRDDMPALHALLKDEGFAETVRAKTSRLFDVTLSYLEQEGFFDGVPYALADTGWRGSSQYALSALMQKGRVRPDDGLTGYYIGLNTDAYNFTNDSMEAFLFDWRHSRRDYRLYYFLCFEMLFAADHGRTRSYQQTGDGIHPVFAEPPDEEIVGLVRSHHAYAVEYARRVSSKVGIDAFDEATVEVAQRLAKCFICTPTKLEAEIYGEWPIAGEIGEGDFQRMAPPMGFKQFAMCALGREKIRGFWPQASLVRESQNLFATAYNLFLDTGALDWYRRFLLRY